MRFASIRDFRVNASAILSAAGRDETVIVTLRGKPVALFVPVEESHLESMMQAVKLARLKDSVDSLRRQAAKAGSDRLSASGIDREVRAARRARHA
jgi:prevent-host-death family protein